MRSAGVTGGLVVVGLCVAVACSSSEDAAPPPAPDVEAGSDAPVGPPVEGEGGSDAGPGNGDGVQHGGTRIKLRGVQTAEGTFLYTSPYDSMLDSICYPVRTVDGVLRCVPLSDATVTAYADINCTTLLASVSTPSCVKPTLAVKYTSSATDHCDTRFTVYKVGGVVAAPKVYTMDPGVGCVQHDAPPNTEYHAVTSEIPSTDLVTFTESLVPLTPDLGAYVLDGADGSRIQRAYFADTKRGKACEPYVANDGQMHCMPRAKAAAGGFSDMGCTVGTADPRECVVAYEQFDDSTALQFDPPLHCKSDVVHAFPIGAKRASRDEFTSDHDGGCFGPVTSPRDVYDVGPELSPAAMPVMTPSGSGGPRVVESTLVSGGVIAQHLTDRQTDTMLGGTCHFAIAADGKLRCLPDGDGAYFYSDDKCTTPLAVQVDDCTPVKYTLRNEPSASGCTTQHVHLPGTKLDPASTPAYTGTGAADCLLVGGSNSLAYYTLGAEVPASTFEEAAYVTK